MTIGRGNLTASPHTPGGAGADAPESPWPSPLDRSVRGGQPAPWAGPSPEDKIYDDDMLPKLHLHAYRGDLSDVLQCITDGHSVHDTIIMRNQTGRLVCGITPLFLAAQRGHYKLVKLLVGNGANPAQPAYIQGSADLCTPLQVARLNLHFKVAMYLNKMVKTRKEEDKVLKEEEEGISAAQRTSDPQPDPARGTQHTVMANLGDLSGWDPGSGAQPPLQTGNLIARMLKRNKVDLMTWRPDMERTKEGEEQMMASAHRPVEANELEGLEVANHTNILNNFLQDADLAAWNPEADEAQSVAPATSVAATGRRSLDLDNNSAWAGAGAGLQSGGGGGVAAYAGSDSASRNESPTPTLRNQHMQQGGAPSSSYVGQQQHMRAAAAAAVYRGAGGATAAAAQPVLPAKAPARVAATRWYAHGGSDSEEEEEDMQASASVPAAAPVALRA